jgi:hypothetical protein
MSNVHLETHVATVLLTNVPLAHLCYPQADVLQPSLHHCALLKPDPQAYRETIAWQRLRQYSVGTHSVGKARVGYVNVLLVSVPVSGE